MDQYVLEILDGDRAGEVVSLDGTVLRIGRKPQNDLVLADEKTSGVHAEVVVDGSRYVLRDLGSTNGTLMDGHRITEVVLSDGDMFTVGRINLRFVDKNRAATAGSEASDLQVGRIDASRLQAARSSRSVGLLVLLLVVAGAAGGYMWWSKRPATAGGIGGPRAAGPIKPLVVAGNELAAGVADCEGEQGWQLRFAGVGFTAGGSAHTGTGSLKAERLSGEGVSAEDAATDFAIARSEAFAVSSGRSLGLQAHLKTAAGGRGAVRICFFTESQEDAAGDGAFTFRTGTQLTEAAGYQKVSCAVPVPSGAELAVVELLAVLPTETSVVWFDDIAAVEGGDAEPSRQKIEGAGSMLWTGESLAIASVSPASPITLHGIVPAAVAAELAGLSRAGHACMTDAGATLAHEVDERGATLRVSGVSAMELVFPASSAGGLMVQVGEAGQERFLSVGVDSVHSTRRLLLGEAGNRCLVELESPAEVRGALKGGFYRLALPTNSCRLYLSFRSERDTASRLYRDAQQASDAGRPGEALDVIRRLVETVPHDLEVVSRSLELRASLEDALAARLQRISDDLEEAQFFRTRGGYQRVLSDLQSVREIYFEHNLPDAAAVAALQQGAEASLQTLELERSGPLRARLEAMAKAFDEADKKDLARLVRDYMTNHLK
jgi:pSer/pThr/pTyr-binding forkhead associated (FHA) protein